MSARVRGWSDALTRKRRHMDGRAPDEATGLVAAAAALTRYTTRYPRAPSIHLLHVAIVLAVKYGMPSYWYERRDHYLSKRRDIRRQLRRPDRQA